MEVAYRAGLRPLHQVSPGAITTLQGSDFTWQVWRSSDLKYATTTDTSRASSPMLCTWTPNAARPLPGSACVHGFILMSAEDEGFQSALHTRWFAG